MPNFRSRPLAVDRSRALAIFAALAGEGDRPSERLCQVCANVVQVAGGSVTIMAGDAEPAPLCVSNALAARIEDLQHTLGEGPTLDAHRDGVAVSEPDLPNPRRSRWPVFAPMASAEGAGALFAFPLRIGAIQLGALTLHQLWPGPLTDDQFGDALVMAQVTVNHVLGTQAGASGGRLGGDLEMLAAHRAEVHQATGMVSIQLRVSLVDALVRLRAHAYAEDRPLADVAADVVARRLRLA